LYVFVAAGGPEVTPTGRVRRMSLIKAQISVFALLHEDLASLRV
jgi:hypothetical protein